MLWHELARAFPIIRVHVASTEVCNDVGTLLNQAMWCMYTWPSKAIVVSLRYTHFRDVISMELGVTQGFVTDTSWSDVSIALDLGNRGSGVWQS